MAEVNWTAEAQRWLRDIYDYIAADNVDAALRVVLGITRKLSCCDGFRSWDMYTPRTSDIAYAFCCTATTGLAMSSRRTATSTYLGFSTGRSILIATCESVLP